MERAKPETGAEPRRNRGRGMLLAAFAAFVVANLLHNRFGLDPAIVPAAVLAVLYVRRPRRGLLWGAAFVIAAPALLFLDRGALLDPADTLHFLNHLALLGAGALAIASVVLGTPALRGAARPTQGTRCPTPSTSSSTSSACSASSRCSRPRPCTR